MEKKHYIAQVGSMWVSAVLNSIGNIHLGSSKKYASHLNEKEIEWIKEAIPFATIIEVKVTIEETELHETLV